MRLHIDTDLGGDPDDACALAMVLGWHGDVELTAITTTADPDGRRAGYARSLLELMGVDGVPVASGAARSSTTGQPMGGLPDHTRYWAGPCGDVPAPAPHETDVDAALDLLRRSVEAGATIAAIGPYTNLALLEAASPGALDAVPVFAMGGWVDPFPAGFPRWQPERDWNVQCDTVAAQGVFASQAALTFVPCAAAVTAFLRTTDLPRLSAAGRVGSLLARQSVAHGEDNGYTGLGSRHPGLKGLVNFHWDPVTCATALGWTGGTVSQELLRPVLDDGLLRFERHPRGRRTQVVNAVDGDAFSQTWLGAVEVTAGAGSSHNEGSDAACSRRAPHRNGSASPAAGSPWSSPPLCHGPS